MPNTTIYTIINQKGGTGKTTTAVNLSCAIAKKRKKVLLIDLDPQGNLSYWLGCGEIELSVGDWMLGECLLEDVAMSREGVDVIPSDMNLADLEINIASMDNRESLLKTALGQIEGYDYVIIDCPPSLSLLTVNALTASNKVIVPLQMEVLSLQGLDQIISTVGKIKDVLNPDLQIEGLLPVMVDNRRKLSKEVHDHISQNYEVNIFKSRIRTNVRISEAPSFGESVLSYSPSSNSAADYTAFAKEILSLNKKK
ncbi:ParA family protein [Reichenbachiella versicolor]|uniref:ParA family protein n=1 Tax=Reichenbachiella versicolor TaxID=1821036 RepID=UPI000D6DF62C|nr:AAA family ATPase [Reichenbachiella versicolor]